MTPVMEKTVIRRDGRILDLNYFQFHCVFSLTFRPGMFIYGSSQGVNPWEEQYFIKVGSLTLSRGSDLNKFTEFNVVKWGGGAR